MLRLSFRGVSRTAAESTFRAHGDRAHFSLCLKTNFGSMSLSLLCRQTADWAWALSALGENLWFGSLSCMLSKADRTYMFMLEPTTIRRFKHTFIPCEKKTSSTPLIDVFSRIQFTYNPTTLIDNLHNPIGESTFVVSHTEKLSEHSSSSSSVAVRLAAAADCCWANEGLDCVWLWKLFGLISSLRS